MGDTVTLTCPSCGGKLHLTDDIERFACAHCGTEHIVRRRGGVISLNPIVEGLSKVRIGVDRTASELAIKRLEKEIRNLESEKKHLQVRLNNISSTTSTLSLSFILSLLFFITLFFSGLGWDSGCTSLTGIITVILLAGVISSLKSKSSRNKSIENRQKELNEEIRRKKSEIENHKDIVSTL